MFARFLYEFSYQQFSDKIKRSPAAESLTTIVEAQKVLDRLTEKSLKVPIAMDYSAATIPFNLNATLRFQSAQQALNNELDSWAHDAIQLGCQHSQSDPYENHHKLMLETRWLACKIWTNLGSSAIEQQSRKNSSRRIFEILTGIFGMSAASPVDTMDIVGLERISHHILLESRDLDLRLAILDRFRERLYFSGGISGFQMLYATAKRAIEDDHGIVLGSEWSMLNMSPFGFMYVLYVCLFGSAYGDSCADHELV
ncbi:C6 zinc finger domain protein [Penicillium sp. IBT 16267x]|nr:C6 zinc finger domain protein [Penicillium sp. IBT 16267x]